MTITKKVGALLLLLTIGSLVGILTFAVFLRGTAVDFIFFLSATNEERLLQQLYVNNVMIRDGHEEIRVSQRQLIRDFDALLEALENGGKNPSGWTPVELTERVQVAATQPVGTLESAGPEVIRVLTLGMPVPGTELRSKITRLRGQWTRLQDSFLVSVERPKDDPAGGEASRIIQTQMQAISEASRQVLATAATGLLDKRQTMLITLASIASLSIVLFGVGLLFTRRFIARPIQDLRTASQRIGSGDFVYRVPVKRSESSDELADLGKTFNKMADEIYRSLERYRELFENANDFVYTADLTGRFLTLNKAAESISGYTREELLQKTFSDLIAPEDAASLGEGPREIHVLAKDGKRVSLEDSSRVIYENGTPIGIQGVARDVTERNRLKEQLDLSQRMEAIGRLAGGIAHDFGNVLTIIEGYCMLIRSGLKQDDPLQDEAEGIRRASQRAASMIRHLLGFSRGQILSPRPFNIEKALGETTDVLRRLIGEDIELETKVAPHLGYVHMDPAQLEQILVNLALNARDSMPEGGKLAIEVSNMDVPERDVLIKEGLHAGPYVRLTVTDTGCGMTPEVLSRIFEPFFSTKSQGTGLGLSSVYSVVRQSGGQISAESRLGEGTTMTIHLPRVLQIAEAEEPATQTRYARGTETILLVEDEVNVRRFVREMLRTEGYSVVEARDQNEAIALCGRPDERIDLVLTDVVMPNMSGPELAIRLRVLRPHLKVLFMSGYPRDEFDRNLQVGEKAHFIQKPLSSEILAEKVQEVLHGQV
jgi:PAS domain S-box-containing protein